MFFVFLAIWLHDVIVNSEQEILLILFTFARVFVELLKFETKILLVVRFIFISGLQ